MKTVWKFPLNINGQSAFDIPIGAKILSIGAQGGELVLWALVDPEAQVKENRRFISLLTGQLYADIDINMILIGTVQFDDDAMPNGKFVVHVFEEK